MKFLLLAFFALFNIGVASTADSAIDLNTPLDGHYEMSITIGDKVYVDLFDFYGNDQPINMSNFNGQVKGSITVVGNFKVPLFGAGSCQISTESCEFHFEITAQENGEDFKVLYTANFLRDDYIKYLKGEVSEVKLTGSAFLEDGSLLGHFTAIRTKN